MASRVFPEAVAPRITIPGFFFDTSPSKPALPATQQLRKRTMQIARLSSVRFLNLHALVISFEYFFITPPGPRHAERADLA